MQKLAFVINQGLYELLGYKNAPESSEKNLNKHDMNFSTDYSDDFKIYSDFYAEHLAHLETIFNICCQENLKLKFSHCNFTKSQIDFLGYENSNDQMKPDNANTKAVKK